YDDALDTFGVHAVGGTLGAFVTGLLATKDANPNLAGDNMKAIMEGNMLWLEQLKAMGLTLVLSIVATVAIAYLLKITIGLRPSAEDEESGLDVTDHGERGYHHEHA
ncbi:MAG TPA: ammonia channel protein, partial [Polyangiaceae bacterium]|nr:ammonia channel protein [Polyangiaceae bacterium]